MGKFHLTAIDAQSQIKRATELWGPYGSEWGLSEIDFQLLPTKDGQGLVCKAVFFYPHADNNKAPYAEFPIASDMPYNPKDDCVKKLQTECISKALSRLGFNSDVFEGKFDDNKYVQQRREECAASKSSGDTGGASANANPKPAEESPKANPKAKKIPEPNPVESGILAKAAQAYLAKAPEGYIVDYKKLCRVVYEEFDKYPQNEASIPIILERVKLDSVITKNDFLSGI